MTKEDARKARANLNGKKIDGCAVEVGINVSFSINFMIIFYTPRKNDWPP